MKLIEHCDRSRMHRHPATSRWAFGDKICRRVPRGHARSVEYRSSKAALIALLSLL
jgi:hypothetical protein